MRVAGSVRPPGDKSITHRALLMAALAEGSSTIRGALVAEDTRAMAACLRRLGAAVSPLREGGGVRVTGGEWMTPDRTLHCGNSGTAARLLLGALAGHPLSARLTGDRSLRRRPMRRVTEPLRRMGARFDGEETLPLTVHGGALRELSYRSPVASAQVKTALLVAGLVGQVPVQIEEPWRSRDHTERLLAALGYDIACHGTTVTLKPGPGRPPPLQIDVPGDPSSAAFLIAAALLADDGELLLEGVGVNPTRIGMLRVLQRMGAMIERDREREHTGEPVADLVVRPGPLRGTTVGAGEIPGLVDEIPVLAVLASRAEGDTVFHEVGELRVKESDRLELIARNLRAVGADAEVRGEDLVVRGGAPAPRGRVETDGDHRIAMAFAVLGTMRGAAVRLSEERSPGVSYPTFFRDLRRVIRAD